MIRKYGLFLKCRAKVTVFASSLTTLLSACLFIPAAGQLIKIEDICWTGKLQWFNVCK